MTVGWSTVSASASQPPVNATGTVACSSVTGKLKFLPNLTLSGGSSEMVSAKLKFFGCNATGSNVTSTDFKAKATGSWTLPNNLCSSVLAGSGASGSLSIVWSAKVGTVKVNPTTLTLSSLTGVSAGANGNAGFTFDDQSTAGSFAGFVTGEIDSNQTAASLNGTSGCESKKGLKKLTVAAGRILPTPLPSFQSLRTLPADFGADGVAVDSATGTVYVTNFGSDGAVYQTAGGDLTTFNETSTQSTTQHGPYFQPTGIVFDSGTYFYLNSFLSMEPTSPVICPTAAPAGDIHSGSGTYIPYLPSGSWTGMAADTSTHTLYFLSCTGSVEVMPESLPLTHAGGETAISVGSGATAIAVDSSNHNVYVGFANHIAVIDESGDANNGQIVHTIPVAAQTLTVDTATHAVYAFASVATSLAVIDESGDANTGTVTSHPQIPGGDDFEAYAETVDPTTHYVYATGSDLTQGTLTGFVIDERNDGHTGQVISAPIAGHAIAVDPSTHLVFAAGSPGTPGSVDVVGTAP
jgi:hypothetical protein